MNNANGPSDETELLLNSINLQTAALFTPNMKPHGILPKLVRFSSPPTPLIDPPLSTTSLSFQWTGSVCNLHLLIHNVSILICAADYFHAGLQATVWALCWVKNVETMTGSKCFSLQSAPLYRSVVEIQPPNSNGLAFGSMENLHTAHPYPSHPPTNRLNKRLQQ